MGSRGNDHRCSTDVSFRILLEDSVIKKDAYYGRTTRRFRGRKGLVLGKYRNTAGGDRAVEALLRNKVRRDDLAAMMGRIGRTLASSPEPGIPGERHHDRLGKHAFVLWPISRRRGPSRVVPIELYLDVMRDARYDAGPIVSILWNNHPVRLTSLRQVKLGYCNTVKITGDAHLPARAKST